MSQLAKSNYSELNMDLKLKTPWCKLDTNKIRQDTQRNFLAFRIDEW